MPTPKDLPRDIGGFIRELRRSAKISLRQLAKQAGVSNPYLSQVERGLRKPSAEVLQQLANALRISTPMMYLRAGLLDDKDGPGVLAAIAADDSLTMAQKQALSQIYETFRQENARMDKFHVIQATNEAVDEVRREARTDESTPAEQAKGGQVEAAPPTSAVTEPPASVVKPEPADSTAELTEAVIESVAVSEVGATPAPSAKADRAGETDKPGPQPTEAASAVEEEMK